MDKISSSLDLQIDKLADMLESKGYTGHFSVTFKKANKDMEGSFSQCMKKGLKGIKSEETIIACNTQDIEYGLFHTPFFELNYHPEKGLYINRMFSLGSAKGQGDYLEVKSDMAIPLRKHFLLTTQPKLRRVNEDPRKKSKGI